MTASPDDLPPPSTRIKAAFSASVDGLVERYFSAEERTLHLTDGETVLEEDKPNDRLYYVRSGQLVGHSNAADSTPTDLLIVGPGEFAGVRSFSAPEVFSAATVSSDGESVVCYATLEDIRKQTTRAPEQVLLPIFIQAMLSRQKLAYQLQVVERDMAKRIGEMQEMSQLGQFSAGVAHELNNAISVIDRGADWLARALDRQVEGSVNNQEYAVFKKGIDEGRRVTSREARSAAKDLVNQHHLSPPAARDIAQMGLDAPLLKQLGKNLSKQSAKLHELWELGATFHDVTIAARQAASVVESMKHLGGRQNAEPSEVDVHETLHLALTIMRGMAHGVAVDFDLTPEPVCVRINKGELVQVWVNLINNACDAMPDRSSNADGAKSHLFITSRRHGEKLVVTIKDTGSGIPDKLLHTIFRPNFTTKKTGLSFGLGIGLSIVRRIATGAGGSVEASNWEQGATFTVTLPIAPSVPPAL